MKRSSEAQIPPAPVVRFVAGVLLLISLFIAFIVIINLTTFDTVSAILILLGVLISSSASVMGLITGQPSWVLLHLFTPW